MKYYILASLILFGLIIRHNSRKGRKQNEQNEKSFWQREEEANNVRRKPLDDLEYITLPLEEFPVSILSEDEKVKNCVETIQKLATQKIVNLTGYTNTDLKLMYGTANITPLTEYDQNYTLLVRTLQEWANLLYEASYLEEAQTLLEFAVSTHTDISKTYYLLAEIYSKNLDFSKIESLTEAVKELKSLNKNTILRTLQESYQ